MVSALCSRGQFVGSSGVDLRREIKRFIICRSQSNQGKHKTQACTVFAACSVFLYITSCTFIVYFFHDILKHIVKKPFCFWFVQNTSDSELTLWGVVISNSIFLSRKIYLTSADMLKIH